MWEDLSKFGQKLIYVMTGGKAEEEIICYKSAVVLIDDPYHYTKHDIKKWFTLQRPNCNMT